MDYCRHPYVDYLHSIIVIIIFGKRVDIYTKCNFTDSFTEVFSSTFEVRFVCPVLTLIHSPFSVQSCQGQFFIQNPLLTPTSIPLSETCRTNSIWVSSCHWRTGMARFQQFYEKLKMRDMCADGHVSHQR